MPTPRPHPQSDAAHAPPVAIAAELLSELSGGCPSVTALLERLIDRQAAKDATGAQVRP